MQKQFQIMDQKAADHDYLHKDFHGALSYAILYLDKTFGLQATIEYLQQVGRTCYAPLSAQIKKLGLSALEKHLRHVFTKEEGRFTIHYEGIRWCWRYNNARPFLICEKPVSCLPSVFVNPRRSSTRRFARMPATAVPASMNRVRESAYKNSGRRPKHDFLY